MGDRLLLEVEEYLDEVLELVSPVAEVERPKLFLAAGRVLAEPVVAAGPVPTFRNSAMDGFAMRAAELTPGVQLRVVAEVPAGSALDPALGPGECVRIMTGAPLPTDADTVVPVEVTSEADGVITFHEVREQGAHVRDAGHDFEAGAEVLPRGAVLTPAAVGLAASAGAFRVPVVRRPRVVVVATGDELRQPGTELSRGQIHESNGHYLEAAAAAAGADVVRRIHLPDDPLRFRLGLNVAAQNADLVVLSGGVSVGDHDVVRIVLSEADAAFRHVRMQPGKPQGWARWPLPDGSVVPLVALPGNPLSTVVSFELFVRPALDRLLGRASRGWGRALAAEGWRSPSGRRQILPVVAETDDAGRLGVRPAHRLGSASHMVSAAALANALAMVGADVDEVAAGDLVGFRPL